MSNLNNFLFFFSIDIIYNTKTVVFHTEKNNLSMAILDLKIHKKIYLPQPVKKICLNF